MNHCNKVSATMFANRMNATKNTKKLMKITDETLFHRNGNSNAHIN